jgi:flagellar biosynthesis/type III secretory pathway M-ring protein FliF/YscJ
MHSFISTTITSIDITESLLADNRVLHSYSKLDKAKETSQEQIVEHLYSSWKGDSAQKKGSTSLNVSRSPFAGIFNQIVEKDLIPSLSTVRSLYVIIFFIFCFVRFFCVLFMVFFVFSYHTSVQKGTRDF